MNNLSRRAGIQNRRQGCVYLIFIVGFSLEIQHMVSSGEYHVLEFTNNNRNHTTSTLLKVRFFFTFTSVFLISICNDTQIVLAEL